LLEVLANNGVFKSKGEGRRLIQQGGVSVNDVKLENDKKVIEMSDFKDDMILVKRGKKKFYKIVIK
ncbi:MAG: S4 domain-containing protein, partial [Sarcina sp.]